MTGSGQARDPGAALRTRLFIPAADTSTVKWLEDQENVSVSLRAVIHAYIERHGYGDVFCREVTQQSNPGGSGEAGEAGNLADSPAEGP